MALVFARSHSDEAIPGERGVHSMAVIEPGSDRFMSGKWRQYTGTGGSYHKLAVSDCLVISILSGFLAKIGV
jgi:hypothetical protein